MLVNANTSREIYSQSIAVTKSEKVKEVGADSIDTTENDPAVVVCFGPDRNFCATDRLNTYNETKKIKPDPAAETTEQAETLIGVYPRPNHSKSLEQLLENSTKRLVHYANKNPVTKKILNHYDSWLNENVPSASLSEKTSMEYFNKYLSNNTEIAKRAEPHMKFFNYLFSFGQKTLEQIYF